MHGRQPSDERQSVDSKRVAVHERIAGHIERQSRTLQRLKGRRDVFCVSDFEGNDIKAHRVGRLLNFAHFQHQDGIARIVHDPQSPQPRHNLA